MAKMPLYVVGAGGFAREVVECVVDSINHVNDILSGPVWDFQGYVEKSPEDVGKKVGRHKVVCCQEELKDVGEAGVVIAIGNPKIIDAVSEDLHRFPNLFYPNLIHPATSKGHNVEVGKGNIICEGNIFTTDIQIGDFNILNLGSTFGHDTFIGDCCVINPGAHISGGSNIGNRCLFGTGSIILENLCVEPDSTIGGGAVVTRNVPTGTTVVGIPAKPLKGR